MKTRSNIIKRKGYKLLSKMLCVLVTVSFTSVGMVRVNAATMTSMGTMLMPGAIPDYFGSIPNYANSPLPEIDASGNIIAGTGIRKFVDSLAGLGAANANDLGQYMPVAVPDITTYPGSDYYEIELRQYTEKLHKDLPVTTLRGYVQVNTTDPKVSKVNYLGPMIIASKDRPVRVKFTNKLPTGSGGDLFLPVDTTIMGAGTGPNMGTENYTQNRATLHLHGGVTPWISDGTPHQWITPAGEKTSYPTGVSVHNVPDMPDPGPGSETFFYTNQESARLMFYHDHSYGITRLNVYAGEAAGYILRDKTEQDLIASGAIPATEIPLIIQDKTFVPKDAQLGAEDPTWDKAKWGGLGNLWFPHVYMTNQNPTDITGANAMGRWDYGPWFWPPYTGLKHGTVPNPLYPSVVGEPKENPGVPNISAVPEAYMDTPLVNGTAYPYLDVQPKPYRFRILNASNDRFWNLQLYTAKSNNTMWNSSGALLDANAGEVPMVPAVTTIGYPTTWPSDGRVGGVPDPAAAGPNIIQIGTESGFLPAPVELVNQPIDYNYNRRDIVVLNVSNKTLFMGPAERADVIIDFSKYAGKTLILYNDSPAPVPAFDPRNDYYTGDPDQTSSGGAPTTKPGYGPNTRTIMQIKVASINAPVQIGNPFGIINKVLPSAYTASQHPLIVPQGVYARIQDNSLTFAPVGSITPIKFDLQPKAIQELFETDYGRMNATMGMELPNTNVTTQTTIPYGYIDPVTEKVNAYTNPVIPVASDGTQLWKITHNGVDTHAIHFHLFDVQVINRVGWDGAIRPPDPNEMGIKDTVKMSPLEDVIIALRAITPSTFFGVPDSIRPLDVTMPIGSTGQFMGIDPKTNNPITVANELYNFDWEYMWHCHLLGHEENDMMRPIAVSVPHAMPTASVLSYTRLGKPVNLTWTDPTPTSNPTTIGNPANEIGFKIERAIIQNRKIGVYKQIAQALANVTSYVDTTSDRVSTYSYRVTTFNATGAVISNSVKVVPK